MKKPNKAFADTEASLERARAALAHWRTVHGRPATPDLRAPSEPVIIPREAIAALRDLPPVSEDRRRESKRRLADRRARMKELDERLDALEREFMTWMARRHGRPH